MHPAPLSLQDMVKPKECAPNLLRLIVPTQQRVHGERATACVCLLERAVRVVALLSHGNQIKLILYVLCSVAFKLKIGPILCRELFLANRR